MAVRYRSSTQRRFSTEASAGAKIPRASPQLLPHCHHHPIAIITLPFPGCSPHLPPLQDVSKRLSLPMDIRLPPEFLQKLQMESPEFPKPLSRMSRRASLVSHSTAQHLALCIQDACADCHPATASLWSKLPCSETHTVQIPFCTLIPCAYTHLCTCTQAPFPVLLLHMQIPSLHIAHLAHTWLLSQPFTFQGRGGGEPPVVPQVLEPLLMEMQMWINNELPLALMLTFQFLDCRASAYVGAKTQCPVCKLQRHILLPGSTWLQW